MMFEADVPNALFSQMEGDLSCVDEVLQIEATSAETRETMSQRQNDRKELMEWVQFAEQFLAE